MNRRLRILLVDDHEVVRCGFRRLLELAGDFEVAAEAAAGEDAYRLLASTSPDVVVMDISMPGLSGIETLRRMRAGNRHVKILIFSVHESAGVVQRTLDAGASGYLSKASAAEEMVTAVRAVAANQRYLGAQIARNLASVVREPRPGAAAAQLSRREFEVLRLFSTGRSIEEAAGTLSVSPKTVANSLSAIKHKLGTRSHAELMRLALVRGLPDGLPE
jgi:DNA-binding NarL/FixJ family response regulator